MGQHPHPTYTTGKCNIGFSRRFPPPPPPPSRLSLLFSGGGRDRVGLVDRGLCGCRNRWSIRRNLSVLMLIRKCVVPTTRTQHNTTQRIIYHGERTPKTSETHAG